MKTNKTIALLTFKVAFGLQVGLTFANESLPKSDRIESTLSTIHQKINFKDFQNKLPPELLADLILSAMQNDYILAKKNEFYKGFDEKANLSNQSENSTSKVNDLQKNYHLMVKDLIPQVKQPYPIEALIFSTENITESGSMLSRASLSIRLADMLSQSDSPSAFDFLLGSMKSPISETKCGAGAGPTDAQLYEWLDSLLQNAPSASAQVELLARAMAAARSQFAIDVFSRALLRYDLASSDGRKLIAAYSNMLSNMPAIQFVSGQLIFKDFVGIRELMGVVGIKTEAGKTLSNAVLKYASRRLKAGYCPDYMSTDFYPSEKYMLEEILKKEGLNLQGLGSIPDQRVKSVTEMDRENSIFMSTNIGQVLAGPSADEAKTPGGLYKFVDRMLPGAKGPAKRRLVGLLLWDWKSASRPAPPSVSAVVRAMAILDDKTFWNGDTENWRLAVNHLYSQIALSTPAARDQLMVLAKSSQNMGIRAYGILADTIQNSDSDRLALNRRAEAAELESLRNPQPEDSSME